MRKQRQFRLGLIYGCLSLWLVAGVVHAENVLTWNKEKNEVTADVRGLGVTNLLERVASQTGWQVFLEPGIAHQSSAKFSELPTGEALRMLLGDVNFALIPQTNAALRLYVFRTAMGSATQQISGERQKVVHSPPRRVPGELIVRLKPGENIDEIARALGATVVGSIPELNVYRLRFDDPAALQDAYDALTSNPSVANVEYNYYMDRPQPPQGVISSTSLPGQLRLKPAGDSSGIVVGIVDTGVQPLGSELDKLVTKHLSVNGDTSANNDTPLHGTTMLESILRGVQSTGADSTSAQFISVDVFGNNGSTTTFDVASGIVMAVNNGANWVNVSLGSAGDSSLLQTVVQNVADRGIAIFAAAGNEPTGDPVYPAAYPGAVAVTALSAGQLAPYANMANFVDLAAPGAGIIYYEGKPYFVQGTSVSTAFTTGAAVGLSEKNSATWAQVQPVLFKALAIPPTAAK